LVSNAVSQIPRPGLYPFLERVIALCDLTIYTSVCEQRGFAIRKILVVENGATIWFEALNVIQPAGTLKPKSACGREDAFLLDDQVSVIMPGEEDWWIQIPEFLPSYSDEDKAHSEALLRLRKLL